MSFRPLCLVAFAVGLAGCASVANRPAPPLIPLAASMPSDPVDVVSTPAPETPRPAPPVSSVERPYPDDAPAIFAASAIAVDAVTGRTIYSKNPDVERPVASTQKLLTALLIVRRGGLDTPVRVAESDTMVEPSKLGIKAGETYTRRQLLTAMMVKSSNDAAACLARNHSGSVEAFAAEMNRFSALLGNTSSHFLNPHGLTEPGQYSTARDIARIALAAYREPVLRQLMALRGYTFRYADGRVRYLESTNLLLGKHPYVNGMKTGYTIPSGRCLVTSARAGDREIILVQLGSNTRNIFDDAGRLVDWGLRRTDRMAATAYPARS